MWIAEVGVYGSFLDNAPNYLVRCIIQKRITTLGSGKIWYRNTTNSGLLERAKKQIVDAFQVLDFEPRELFIATWDQVGYYKEKSRKVNTFQAVIGMYVMNTNVLNIFFKYDFILKPVSSGTESYVIFNYPQNGIQWIKSQGKNRNMPDAKAQVGLISGRDETISLLDNAST